MAVMGQRARAPAPRNAVPVRRDGGAAAVEFALVFPLLLLLLFGIVEFSIAFYAQQGTAAAAREAARRAAVGTITSCSGGSGSTDLASIVADTAPGVSTVTGRSLKVTEDTGDTTLGAGDEVAVTVTYDVKFNVLSALIPGFPVDLTGLTATGRSRVENLPAGAVTSC